ncbi:shikimate 5-dehydrogenase [Gilliamella sp. Pra-s65]|uniref:shikimate 5-dehydrogenase n=1 Tax=unclassified Gilliamella TaxID=2685620 RepID=UPI0013659DA9|nr:MULTISPECIES: shikimate 5-dehydrogenase [unclassified Gilliamella]MWN90519.1 shikimate 5-dehydrogenase [Gilliamella sp. Pra-s65]MWP46083.1 shikimate 5-dehydrogenase [Gilliamella sp. Pas-s27]MWP73534.1 shikimate 5-dehydrogenase [Gilliamella sp. Pra-s52]
MTRIINKDTTVCMSLSARPSNFGTRFHNYLYEKLDLNYLYKAFTTNNLKDAIYGIKALAIRGCAISMPYKEACIEFIDELDDSVKSIQSVNTIVNTNHYLKAYNTDYIAVAKLIVQNKIDNTTPFVLKGSGGMANAVIGAFYDAGFKNGIIAARNQSKGETLAKRYGYQWVKNEQTIPSQQAKLIINVTPIGMLGGVEAQELAFPKEMINNADVVFDVVALPVETPMIKYAQQLNKTIISGADVAVLQALEQFVLYTGITPSEELVKQAGEFARQG